MADTRPEGVYLKTEVYPPGFSVDEGTAARLYKIERVAGNERVSFLEITEHEAFCLEALIRQCRLKFTVHKSGAK